MVLHIYLVRQRFIMEKYLNALDELIKQGKDINDELDKCLNLQEQTIEELKRTNRILDNFNVT